MLLTLQDEHVELCSRLQQQNPAKEAVDNDVNAF